MRITGKESNTFILKELGTRLRDMRVNAGITQEGMCELTGLSHSSIRRIENGENVKIETILNLLRELSILGNIELLVPEQEMSPSQNYDYGKRKQRAYPSAVKEKDVAWKWGEDK